MMSWSDVLETIRASGKLGHQLSLVFRGMQVARFLKGVVMFCSLNATWWITGLVDTVYTLPDGFVRMLDDVGLPTVPRPLITG